jgi:KDO2-lipid IV(A) lauroyltransferase
VFRHALRNYYDTFRLPALSDEAVRSSVVIEGLEHLRDALAPGYGAILVSAHVSSVAFAVQALALALDGHPGTVVVEAVEPPELLDLLLRARSSHGWQYRALGPGLTGELTAALRRNEVVCLVADRALGGAGMELDFFGRPASLPIGPALLSLRTGAPILLAAVSRRPDGRLYGQIGAPMLVGRTGHWRTDVAGLTSRVTASLEYHIGRFPEQWTVLQAIWGPDGR